MTFRQVSKRRRATPRELNTRAMALRPERCTGSTSVLCHALLRPSQVASSVEWHCCSEALKCHACTARMHVECGSGPNHLGGCRATGDYHTVVNLLTVPSASRFLQGRRTSLALFLCTFAFASSRNPTNELHGAPSRGLQRLRRRIRLGKANAVVVSRPTPRSGEAEDVPAERNQKDL